MGMPNMTIMFLDWSCWEVMTLMSGSLGVTEQATQILLLDISYITYAIPAGVQ